MALIALKAIFAVLSEPDNAALADATTTTFPDDNLQIREGQWLVAGNGTATQVSDKLGITPIGVSGSAIVLAVSSYHGRANPEIWDWVASKMGKAINAQSPIQGCSSCKS